MEKPMDVKLIDLEPRGTDESRSEESAVSLQDEHHEPTNMKEVKDMMERHDDKNTKVESSDQEGVERDRENDRQRERGRDLVRDGDSGVTGGEASGHRHRSSRHQTLYGSSKHGHRKPEELRQRSRREKKPAASGSSGSIQSRSSADQRGRHREPCQKSSRDSLLFVKPRALSEVPDVSSKGEVTLTTIMTASYRIRDGVERTPCEKATPFPGIEDFDVFFKREYLQVTGSFKVRGARNALMTLTPEQQRRGVLTTSVGNHALALAQQGRELGIPITVLLAENVAPLRVKLCDRYGALTKLAGRNQSEVKNIALKMETEGENPLTFIDENENPYVISGQGTMGLEIVDQVEDIDAIILPVGGGGLVAGISVAIKTLYPHIKVIAVESVHCPSFKAALDAGRPVKCKTEMAISLADGLSFPKVCELPFQLAKSRVDKVVAVGEDHIALAVLRLLEKEKVIVEGAGAAGLAALIGGYLPELKGKRVVVPLCGGNIDPTVLGRAIERGLTADHRMVRFVVKINDRPGALARLLHLISSTGASVKDLYQERTWLNSSVFSVQVKVVAELRNADHGNEVRAALQQRYHDDLHWSQDAVNDNDD